MKLKNIIYTHVPFLSKIVINNYQFYFAVNSLGILHFNCPFKPQKLIYEISCINLHSILLSDTSLTLTTYFLSKAENLKSSKLEIQFFVFFTLLKQNSLPSLKIYLQSQKISRILTLNKLFST